MAVFNSVEGAGQAVADIIAAGMVPAGMEIMDQLSIEAVEDFVGCGGTHWASRRCCSSNWMGRRARSRNHIGVLEGAFTAGGCERDSSGGE